MALVAVGGYGRAELSLQSDIDVVLLHRGRYDIGQLADRLWYLIWDARMKLGLRHAHDQGGPGARRPRPRHRHRPAAGAPPAGDRSLTDELAHKADVQWRKRSKRWLAALAAPGARSATPRRARWAFLLEPDLKEGRAACADARWLGAGGPVDPAGHRPGQPGAAYEPLLAAWVELHRRTGRPGDRLPLQGAGRIADALGYADADVLGGSLAQAARTIAWTSADHAWARIDSSLTGPLGRARRFATWAVVRGCASGEVAIGDDVDVAGDPAVALRAAAVAMQRTAPSSTGRRWPGWPPKPPCRRCGATPPGPPFADLLAAGLPAIVLLEALDQQGVGALRARVGRRGKPQRNAYHRYTVDRHSVGGGGGRGRPGGPGHPPRPAGAGRPVPRHRRGEPGDYTQNGVRLLADIGPRVGLDEHDTEVLVALCRHHLLLADVSPGATSTTRPPSRAWRACSAAARCWACWPPSPRPGRLAGDRPRRLSDWAQACAGARDPGRPRAGWGPGARGRRRVPRRRPAGSAGRRADHPHGRRSPHGRHARSARPVQPGGGGAVAERPACSDAAVASEGGWAIEVFRVESSFGPTFTWDKVVADLHLALAGRLAIRARLADRVRTYGDRRACQPADAEPEVRFDLHVRRRHGGRGHATDGLGVLYRITSACWPTSTSTSWGPRCRRWDRRSSTRSSSARPTAPRVAEFAILTEIERPCSMRQPPYGGPIRPSHESGPSGASAWAGQCSWWHCSPCSSTPANRPQRVDDPHAPSAGR